MKFCHLVAAKLVFMGCVHAFWPYVHALAGLMYVGVCLSFCVLMCVCDVCV